MTCASHADRFEAGIRLFNDGRFFECHEVWEALWKETRGDQKIFQQGMIQAAAALLNAERHSWRGAASLGDKALAKLDRFDAAYAGIALGEFRLALREFLAAAANAKREGGPAVMPPYPKLRRLPAPDSS